jgi:hypothetical protein
MSSQYSRFLTSCTCCGEATSKKYASTHAGKCKACSEGTERVRDNENALLIDSGYQAYARERGDYDLPDYA